MPMYECYINAAPHAFVVVSSCCLQGEDCPYVTSKGRGDSESHKKRWKTVTEEWSVMPPSSEK